MFVLVFVHDYEKQFDCHHETTKKDIVVNNPEENVFLILTHQHWPVSWMLERNTLTPSDPHHAGQTRIWILKPADPPRLWKTRICENLAFLPLNHVKMQEMFQRPYFSKFWDVSCVRSSAPPMMIDDPSGWPALLSLKLYVSRNRHLIAWTQGWCSRLSQWELNQYKKETNTLGRINWVLETFDMKPLQTYTMYKYYTILYIIQYYTVY